MLPRSKKIDDNSKNIILHKEFIFMQKNLRLHSIESNVIQKNGSELGKNQFQKG